MPLGAKQFVGNMSAKIATLPGELSRGDFEGQEGGLLGKNFASRLHAGNSLVIVKFHVGNQ